MRSSTPPSTSQRTVFTAITTTTAKDLTGDALAANRTWSFTTGAIVDDTVPTVSSTMPANLADKVAINRNITATFSEAMDPVTINAATFTLMVEQPMSQA